MNEQKRSLYEFDWQLLRVNLDFSSLASTVDSVAQVFNFVNDKKYSSKALYKAINLFSAVSMGLHGQMARSNNSTDVANRICIVQEARVCLSQFYNPDPIHFKVNDVVRLTELQLATTAQLKRVHTNLRMRLTGAKKRPGNIRRDEITEYIDMLSMELNSRN